MYLTWYGTASICIQTEKSGIITDPFIPLRGSEVRILAEDFTGHDTVLITHGHIDHIGSLPELAATEKRKIYCSRTPKNTLTDMGIPEEDIREIRPGESFFADDAEKFRVTALQGRHVKFDRKLILKTLFNPRMIICAGNIPPFVRLNRVCREAGETLHYLIEAEGKRLMILGSAALADGVEYPKHCDLLILPYSGRSDIYRTDLELVERLEPKTVLVDHFDDTFPPVSSHVDPAEFILEMERRGIPVIKLRQKERVEFFS